jgi:hypothetical protein
MFNGIANKLYAGLAGTGGNGARAPEFSPIDFSQIRAREATEAAAEVAPVSPGGIGRLESNPPPARTMPGGHWSLDMDAVTVPRGSQARDEARQLKSLVQRAEIASATMKKGLEDVAQNIDTVQNSLAKCIAERLEGLVNTDQTEEYTETPQDIPLPALETLHIQVNETQVELMNLKRHLAKTMLTARSASENVSAQQKNIESAIGQFRVLQNELEKAGGMSPKAKIFFAASVCGIALGTIAGSIPATGDIATRALYFGVTSSIAQAFANLGQFLGGADPKDPFLIKILKVGVNETNDGTLLQGMGRALRFLMVEFPLLQASFTFSEKATQIEGNASPSAANVRIIQEAARSILSFMFTKIVLGEKYELNQILGPLINTAGATGLSVAELRK